MRPLTRRALESLPGPERTAHTAHSHLCRGQAETCCTDSAWKPHSCPARGLVRPQPARGVGPRVAVETEGGCSRHLEGKEAAEGVRRGSAVCKGKLRCARVRAQGALTRCAICVPLDYGIGVVWFSVSQTHSFKTVTAHHQKETVTSHQVRESAKEDLKVQTPKCYSFLQVMRLTISYCKKIIKKKLSLVTFKKSDI